MHLYITVVLRLEHARYATSVGLSSRHLSGIDVAYNCFARTTLGSLLLGAWWSVSSPGDSKLIAKGEFINSVKNRTKRDNSVH